jgi:nucleotide-binding universal stress UspA family protein
VFERILMPVDEGDDIAELEQMVSGLATAFGSEVTVFHIREREITPVETLERESPPESTAFAERVASALEDAGARVSIAVEDGRPDRVPRLVLDLAERIDASLIVLGGHHAHSVRERVMGDIGRVVAHGAHCPVLMMPSIDAH